MSQHNPVCSRIGVVLFAERVLKGSELFGTRVHFVDLASTSSHIGNSQGSFLSGSTSVLASKGDLLLSLVLGKLGRPSSTCGIVWVNDQEHNYTNSVTGTSSVGGFSSRQNLKFATGTLAPWILALTGPGFAACWVLQHSSLPERNKKHLGVSGLRVAFVVVYTS